MLISQLREDLIQAQKAKEAEKVETLRFLISAIRNFAIDAHGAKEDAVNDEEVLAIIKKQVKQHEDSIAQFTEAKRTDLVEKEQKQLDILKTYLPAELSDEKIEKVVKEIIATGNSNFGQVMGQAMGRLKGQASGDRVSTVVKKLLS